MIICTSICANYLPKALTLAKSLREHQKGARFVICLVEESIPDLGAHANLVDEIILARDLGIPRFNSFIFRHRIVEAATAVKGHLFLHLLEKNPGEQDFVYIDPDCMLFSPLRELEEALDRHDIVLTPHLLSPGNVDMELSSLKHGAFNLGFLAIRRSAAGESLVRWWADRLYRFCYEDFAAGLFTDQKWINLAPCFYDVHVLRHPGYNFATWNFLERKLSKSGEAFIVDGSFPLRFVHFSGYDRGEFDECNRRWAEPSRQAFGAELSSRYKAQEDLFKQAGFGSTPWSYATFRDGSRIPDSLRHALRGIGIDELEIDPFRERMRLEGLALRRRVSAKYPRFYGGLRMLKRLLTPPSPQK